MYRDCKIIRYKYNIAQKPQIKKLKNRKNEDFKLGNRIHEYLYNLLTNKLIEMNYICNYVSEQLSGVGIVSNRNSYVSLCL